LSPIPVPNLSPNNSYRTLGFYISPTGSTKKAQEILLSHSIDFASSVVNSRFTKEEAYLSYITVLFPKLRFPLPVLTLTELQCNRIQSPAIQAVLPKMHVNRHTSRAIVFGPLELGGLNLPHVYTTQCIGQLQLLLGHVKMKDKTGTLIMISVSQLQLLVGSNNRFFHLPFPAYAKWIESGWLTSIWNFMHRIKFKLHLKDQWCPSLQRQNDIMLMDYFASLKYQPR
jgi:hypothetical protein